MTLPFTDISPSDIGQGIKTAKTFLEIIKHYWESCKEFFQKKESTNKVIIPENQEEFKEMIPQFDKVLNKSRGLENQILTNFFEEFEILLGYDGIYRIAPKEISEKYLIPCVRNTKEKESVQKIDFVSFEDGNLFNDYRKEPKKIPSIFSGLNLNKFSASFRSLLALSSHSKIARSKADRIQVDSIKRSIKERYGYEGVRFCHCYSIGYIQTYFANLKGIDEKEVEEKMWNFSKMPLFFTATNMRHEMMQQIKNQIADSLTANAPYVALHSLGTASEFASIISQEIVKLGLDKGHLDLKIDRKILIDSSQKPIREYSYIWYTEKGREFHNLFKSLWI